MYCTHHLLTQHQTELTPNLLTGYEGKVKKSNTQLKKIEPINTQTVPL